MVPLVVRIVSPSTTLVTRAVVVDAAATALGATDAGAVAALEAMSRLARKLAARARVVRMSDPVEEGIG
jgi:hypothetical protein